MFFSGRVCLDKQLCPRSLSSSCTECQRLTYRMSSLVTRASPSWAPPPSSALNSRSHDSGALMHTNMGRESHKLQGRCPFFFFFLHNTAVLFLSFSFFSAVFGWRVDTSLVCRPWIKCELGVSQMRVDCEFVRKQGNSCLDSLDGKKC